MTKILLCCAAGMSTSMMVKKMREAATSKNIDVQIEATGLDGFDSHLAECDCVLLGPQIKYKLDDFKGVADAAGKPIAVINTMDYGMMKGDKVLSDALAMIN